MLQFTEDCNFSVSLVDTLGMKSANNENAFHCKS